MTLSLLCLYAAIFSIFLVQLQFLNLLITHACYVAAAAPSYSVNTSSHHHQYQLLLQPLRPISTNSTTTTNMQV